MTEFVVVGILNTGKNFIYTLKSKTLLAKFKVQERKWGITDKVELSSEDLKKAYNVEVLGA